MGNGLGNAPVASPRSLREIHDANLYIDGFNLYYGAVRGRPDCKWLNLESYGSTLLLRDQRLKRVRYLTAPVEALPHDPDQPNRQAAYLGAIAEPNKTAHVPAGFRAQIA